MKVKIETNFIHEYDLPAYESELAAGIDLRANIEEQIILQPNQRVLIPTGIKMELPDGYELQIRPRSGLALKQGITVLNSPGTIDPDYRGDIGVILINHSDRGFVINKGDRIAQGVLAKFERIEFITGKLTETKRGEGGFGSSNKEVNISEQQVITGNINDPEIKIKGKPHSKTE